MKVCNNPVKLARASIILCISQREKLWKGEVKQLTESDTDHMVQRWVIAVILAHDAMGQLHGLPLVPHPDQSQ